MTSARELLQSAADRLPSPNGVALAIMELWEDDSTTVQQLSKLVQADPALSGRLLKLANSAAMGNRPVASIPEAIVRVGMQTVGQLAVAFSLIDTDSDGVCAGFDYQHYWSQCLLMAVLSRGLGEATRLAPPEDLFACGLLARIGILAFSTIYPDEYSALLASEPDDLAAAEVKQFGVDHNELSEALMTDYRVPRALVEPARYHEEPDKSGFDRNSRPAKLTNLLHLACRLATMALQDGPDRGRQMIVSQSLAANLGLSDERLRATFEHGVEEWREWSKLFELPVRDAQSFSEDEKGHAPSNGRPSAMRVFVVGDQVHIAELGQRLTSLDALVTSFEDQNKALQVSLETKADLYIIAADDVKLCRLIRSTEWGNSVCLISVMSHADDTILIESFEAGSDDVISSDISEAELRARLLPVHRLLGLDRAWRKDRSELRRIARELALAHRQQQVLSLTDHLTDLPNRRAALQTLQQSWSHSTREGVSLAVIMIDLDHFKKVNDQYGHAAGDAALKSVASLLKSSAREDETVARIGGEEFLLIGAAASLKDLIIAGERLRRTLESSCIQHEEQTIALTTSMGIAEREPEFDNPEMLLNAADKALYAAKSTGRNRICFYQGGRVRSLKSPLR